MNYKSTSLNLAKSNNTYVTALDTTTIQTIASIPSDVANAVISSNTAIGNNNYKTTVDTTKAGEELNFGSNNYKATVNATSAEEELKVGSNYYKSTVDSSKVSVNSNVVVESKAATHNLVNSSNNHRVENVVDKILDNATLISSVSQNLATLTNEYGVLLNRFNILVNESSTYNPSETNVNIGGNLMTQLATITEEPLVNGISSAASASDSVNFNTSVGGKVLFLYKKDVSSSHSLKHIKNIELLLKVNSGNVFLTIMTYKFGSLFNNKIKYILSEKSSTSYNNYSLVSCSSGDKYLLFDGVTDFNGNELSCICDYDEIIQYIALEYDGSSVDYNLKEFKVEFKVGLVTDNYDYVF